MNTSQQPSEHDAKAELRRTMRDRLRAMDHKMGEAASHTICVHIERLLADSEGPVLSFAPIRRRDAGIERVEEADLGALHDALIAAGRLALPRIDWEERTMRAWLLPRADALVASRDLESRRFGVPEPARGEALDLGQLNTVLVPGLAFDRSGARLGRGAGFYDRFLEVPGGERRGPRLIGVCFACQVVDRVPVELHDRRVGTLVTESGVVGCPDAGA